VNDPLAQRCSGFARSEVLDPAGTAGSYRGYVACDVPLPWPREITEHPDVSGAAPAPIVVLGLVPGDASTVPAPGISGLLRADAPPAEVVGTVVTAIAHRSQGDEVVGRRMRRHSRLGPLGTQPTASPTRYDAPPLGRRAAVRVAMTSSRRPRNASTGRGSSRVESRSRTATVPLSASRRPTTAT
jgi:hypothetical protein